MTPTSSLAGLQLSARLVEPAVLTMKLAGALGARESITSWPLVLTRNSALAGERLPAASTALML
jgi:hypothetical protein